MLSRAVWGASRRTGRSIGAGMATRIESHSVSFRSMSDDKHEHKSWATDERGNRTFNFGPATLSENELVHGCERPGCGKVFDAPGAIAPSEVGVWADFMKGKGIKRVLSLLNEKEYTYYAGDGYKGELVNANGFDPEKVTLVDVYKPGAAQESLAALQAAKNANEKLVLHCSGGKGRTGLILAQYLCSLEGYGPEQASKVIMETAAATGTERKVKLSNLEKYCKNGCL